MYSTLEDLKGYIGGDDWNEDDDTLLEMLGEHAQAIINQQTNKVFEADEDTTRYFDAVADICGLTLTFDQLIASITSVVNGDGETIAAGSYVKEPRNTESCFAITLKGSSGIVWTYTDDPENAIAVTGKWAYSATAPHDIRHAHLRYSAWLYKQLDNYNPDTDRAAVSPDGVLRLPTSIPRDVLAILTPYMVHT